jgi:hypothetical protein
LPGGPGRERAAPHTTCGERAACEGTPGNGGGRGTRLRARQRAAGRQHDLRRPGRPARQALVACPRAHAPRQPPLYRGPFRLRTLRRDRLGKRGRGWRDAARRRARAGRGAPGAGLPRAEAGLPPRGCGGGAAPPAARACQRRSACPSSRSAAATAAGAPSSAASSSPGAAAAGRSRGGSAPSRSAAPASRAAAASLSPSRPPSARACAAAARCSRAAPCAGGHALRARRLQRRHHLSLRSRAAALHSLERSLHLLSDIALCAASAIRLKQPSALPGAMRHSHGGSAQEPPTCANSSDMMLPWPVAQRKRAAARGRPRGARLRGGHEQAQHGRRGRRAAGL